MDVWGQLFRDQMAGEPEPHFFERGDGREKIFRSAAIYFEAQWMPTGEESAVATEAAGWELLEGFRDGPYRISRFHAMGG